MEEMTYKKGNMSIGYDKDYTGQSCLFVFEAKGDEMYVLEKLENKGADFIANSIYELQQERDTYKKQLDEYKQMWKELRNYINANHYGRISKEMNNIEGNNQ